MRPRRVALGICLVALLLRMGAFAALDRAHHPDVWESETIATNLLEGRGFVYPFLGTTYRSYMEPLYPGLCAAVYALTGHSYAALGAVQAVLGALLVWLVFACGRRLATDRAALLAAGLAAIHPGLIAYATKFHPFALDSLLLLLVLWTCLAFAPAWPWRSAVVVGAALGLCVLSRATVLVASPVIGWWLWTHAERSRPAVLALVMGVAALVIAPWVARNAAVHHRFVLTRSGTALVFWLGNNPHAFSGSAATPAGEPLYELVPADERERLRHLGELGQQDLFMTEAATFVRAHPLAFLHRWVLKLGYFWWQSPQAGRLYPALLFRAYQFFYVAMMALVLMGAVVERRRREIWLVLGICLSIALVQSAYYVEGRHRLAIEPLLLLLAGPGLAWLLSRRLGSPAAPDPS
jgi:4-amino-4-deoxy-L-arabinose transferase-like glycosyltransferase